MRLLDGAASLTLVDVPVPEPRGDAVLVRVAGAGVCRSDTHILDGAFAEQVRRPVTLGHEICGTVDAVGPEVTALDVGALVAVMVGWGCGTCRWCVGGHEQLCPHGVEAGSSADGGFAEYVLVPHRRHVVPVDGLDPMTATPLGCAALSAYAAVRRVAPWLGAGEYLAVIGAGGLGSYAVHYATALTGATVIAVDARVEALERARGLGAEHVVRSGEDAAALLRGVTHGEGCAAVIDLVGSDETLRLAAASVATRGVVALLGLAGGLLPYGFETLAPEVTLTTVVAGTIADLHDVVRLARRRPLEPSLSVYPLERVNDALDDLREGRVPGRAVLVPAGAASSAGGGDGR